MAVIPGVSNNELIRTTWATAVANELNTNSVRKNGLNAAGTAVEAMTGALYISPTAAGAAGLRLRNTTNTPWLVFEHTTGTPRYGYVQGLASGMTFLADVGIFRFIVGTTEVAELGASLFKVPTTTRLGAPTGAPLQILDTNGGGVAGTANIGFYPSASSIDTPGTSGGYVGFNGTGFQVLSALGALNLESAAGSLTLNAGAANGPMIFTCGADEVARMSNQLMMIGKTDPSSDEIGTVIYGSGSASSQWGQIRNCTGTASSTNLYLRHQATADANDANFAQFTRTTAGTVIGSIQQNGTTGVTYGTTSDYRLKNDLGPVADPLGKLAALNPLHLGWKDDSGEFDGFFAHEVQAVAPYAVSGVKDAVLADDDEFNPGGIDPQQLDAAKLVPLLTAALQATLGKVDALEARIAALEAV